MCIKDPEHVPNITDVTLNTLRLVLSQPSLQSYVEQNINKVKDNIIRLHIIEAATALAKFALPATRSPFFDLYSSLLRRVTEGADAGSVYERADLVGVVRNIN